MNKIFNAKSYSIVLIAMYFLFLNPYLDVRGYNTHDPAGYISKAISVLKGIGYGEQYAEVFMLSTAQPPVFSLMLSPILAIFGVNFIVLKLFMLLIAALLGVVLYHFLLYFCQSRDKAIQASLLMTASKKFMKMITLLYFR